MPVTSRMVAQALLEAGAVLLRPSEPFTFASGIRSPVYCDNRLLLGNVAVRRLVTQGFVEQYAGEEVVAGPATGGIAWSAWVSETLAIPMAYARSSAKGHGRGRQIEGAPVAGRRILLLEDTISTGESALNAAIALRDDGAIIARCLCIFTWGWQATAESFTRAGLTLHPLATLADVLAVAAAQGQLSASDQTLIQAWASDPQGWGR